MDTTIFKGERFNSNGYLDSKVYFKQTDTHQLLYKDSFHPKHTFSGILKSQLLQFHRICNNKSDFEEPVEILFHSLRQGRRSGFKSGGGGDGGPIYIHTRIYIYIYMSCNIL